MLTVPNSRTFLKIMTPLVLTLMAGCAPQTVTPKGYEDLFTPVVMLDGKPGKAADAGWSSTLTSSDGKVMMNADFVIGGQLTDPVPSTVTLQILSLSTTLALDWENAQMSIDGKPGKITSTLILSDKKGSANPNQIPPFSSTLYSIAPATSASTPLWNKVSLGSSLSIKIPVLSEGKTYLLSLNANAKPELK